MCGSVVDIQSATAEIRQGKKEETRMWANAQSDGCPAEYRWRPLRKFHNSIPHTTPQSLADACRWSAMQ